MTRMARWTTSVADLVILVVAAGIGMDVCWPSIGRLVRP